MFIAITALFLFYEKLINLNFLEPFFFFDKIINFIFSALSLLFEKIIDLNLDFLGIIFFGLILRFINLPPLFFLNNKNNELSKLSRGDNNI